MSEIREVIDQGDTTPSSQDEIYNRIAEYSVNATQEYIYKRLPMVFIDGYTLTKISLTERFIDCASYMSRTGLTFEGCVVYRKHKPNNGIRDVRGIYYIKGAPIYYFNAGRKITRNIEEMKQIILNHIQSLTAHIKLEGELLIAYNNYGITVYHRFTKGRIIKFPKSAEQGHLIISWVPKIPTELQYEKVSSISIYNHEIQFKTEVIKFSINALGGQATLLYNHHDTHVLGIMKSPDHGEKEIELMHGSFYLFTHQRPVQRRGID